MFRPEREAQVIDQLKAINTGPLPRDSVAPIWREIMSASRALETPTRVAYLGPAGTFSEEAALGFFGSSILRQPCASFDEVFHATNLTALRNTMVGNYFDLPGFTLPSGVDAQGLPTGILFNAYTGHDELLMCYMQSVQRAMDA